MSITPETSRVGSHVANIPKSRPRSEDPVSKADSY